MNPARGVRKTVTVVFADVAGSTSLGEQLDPEAVRGAMSRYFEEAQSVLERHGGTVEKFIGDAVMAVFGIPQLHEDDALRAVRAAAELRQCLAALNEELEQHWGARLFHRTGVNTGEVVAGDSGQGQDFATGDAVNVAARLEQSAEAGEILLGPETYRLVREAVRAERAEPLTLKGKTEQVPVWRLVEVLHDTPSLSRRLETPFVGREGELGELMDALERVESGGTCRIVTVLGPPGIGKSRLTHEFVTSVGERAHVVVGRCLPYGKGITYWPLAEIVKEIGGDSPRPALAELVADDESDELIADWIAGAVGISESDARTEEIFWAVRKLIEALARDQTLIVVIDDLHWAEPTFLDLLEYVGGFTSGAVLLLCLARSDLLEVRPSWGAPRANSTAILLQPLSPKDSEALIASQRRHVVSESLRARIVEASEGNPLFVEQMLALHDENRGSGGELVIPPTIYALLGARIDRLAPEERTVIEPASVEGRLFHRGAVSALLRDGEAGGLSTRLMTLVRKQLIAPGRSDFPGDDGFRFVHGLVRDAAYRAIPKGSRADLHERFAEWLEEKAPERRSEYELILGYHLERAYRYRVELGPIGDRERELARRAAEFLAAGGRRALRRGDLPATVKLLDRALSLLPEEGRARLEVLLELGFALFAAGELERSDAMLAEAIQLARDLEDRRLEWRAVVLRSHVQSSTEPERRDLEDVLREALEATAFFEQEGDDIGLARACFLLVDAWWMKGEAGRAAEAAERAVELGCRAGSHRDMAEGLELLSWVLLDGPTPVVEALRQCEDYLERTAGDRWSEATLLAWGAVHRARLGSFAEAREQLTRARAITRDLRLKWPEAFTFQLAGYIEMLADDAVAAEEAMRAAQTLFREVGDTWCLSLITVELSTALYHQGRYDEAFELTEAFDEVPAPYDAEWQIKRRGIRAKALARRGELAEAETLAHEAVELAATTDFSTFHGDALIDLAEVLRIAGRAAEAKPAVEHAVTLYERKGNIVSAGKARTLLRELQRSPTP